MGNEKVGKMEDEAKKRREKLKALRRQRQEKGDADSKTTEKEALPVPELKLRNYQPISEDLKEVPVKKAEAGDVEAHIKEQLEGQTATPTVTDDVDLLNLAPRKPDWDLKRDIKSKMDKLERRTQRAIADLIRERLKESTQADPSHFAEVPDGPQGGYESD
uniref:Coiled-coil domain-containing protein 12 n=1 Tax=Phallusia mammillata TaxID=59560 RepID=A0A6F9D8A1_9ASCI|nr:coiled-coil domain-containing protein 12 [Phallusia mammillata]